MSRAPIFVVGPSRSGTTLLQSVLNRSTEMHVASETHYFDDLRPRLDDPASALDPSGARTVAQYFLPLFDKPYGHHGNPDNGAVDPEQMHAAAAELGDSGDAYFEAFCRLEAAVEHGRPPSLGEGRWGEKTPRHIFRIDDMLAAFPGAHVLAVVRDPRAVVASYARWWKEHDLEADDATDTVETETEAERAQRSFHPVIAAMMCRGAITAAEAAESKHGSDRVTLVRYEDLTSAPEASVRHLCDVVGLTFEEGMLDAPMINSSFEPGNADGGIRSDPVGRWRSVLRPEQIETVQLVCRGVNDRWNYAPVETGASRWAVARVLAGTPLAAFRGGLANKDRIASLPDYVRRRVFPR